MKTRKIINPHIKRLTNNEILRELQDSAVTLI